jgi:DNA-directed RNA polymerase subunit RPC12/RpoP
LVTAVGEELYECAICGYKSSSRAEFVEMMDPSRVELAVLLARLRGRIVSPEDVKYVCTNCSVRLYEPQASS